MLADTLLFAFAILLPSAIVGASYVYYRPFREPFYIVMMVLGVVSLLFAFLLTMNPKLKHWEQLDRTINDNGEAVLMRPKYFVLAYTEWLLIFNFFFCEILLLIINLKA